MNPFFFSKGFIESLSMPFKTRAQKLAYLKAYHQHKREMSHQQAHTFIREIKNSLKRDVSANSAATELMDEFAEISKSSAVEHEVEKLQRELIPNEPADDVEEMYATLNKKERAVERQKLVQKLEFLNTLDANEDIRANQYVEDVRFAMNAKVKAKEAEEANMLSRKRLGKSSVDVPMEPKRTKQQEPRPTSTMWSFLTSKSTDK